MKTYRLRGDWLNHEFIDNFNRQRQLEIIVVGGKAYDPGLYGFPEDAGRLELREDDTLSAWGYGVAFAPEAGELDRVGRQVFKR